MELSEHQQARVEKLLADYVGTVDGVRAAVLASVDGFALAQVAGKDRSGERLAAMTSAMLALAGAVGRELQLGQLQVLMLEAQKGKVLMLSLETRDTTLLLMAACDQRSVIGNVLWSARECGQKVLTELGGA
jgi:predicted regulator of Ras-like GTPase activity (Roadblock/LC7/MglB family)